MRSDSEAIYDQMLVLRFQRGDMTAVEELIARWDRRLLYYIGNLVGQEADALDVLQETWIRVFRHLRKLREPQTLPKWLYTVARNTAFKYVRAMPISPELVDRDAPVESVGIDRNLEVRENAEQVHSALGRLPTVQRDILTLHYLSDVPLQDIAEIIQIPVGTAKSRLFHARQALKRILNEDYGHE